MRQGIIGQRVAIYGADRETTTRVLELLDIERLPHINIIGFADDRRDERVETGMIGRFPFLGGFEELLALAREGMLDQLIVALPMVRQERLNMIIEQLSAGSIDVCIMPREFLVLRDRYRVNYIGSLPVLNVWQQPVRDFDGVLKTVQDWLLAFFGLIILSPLLLLTAVAIKLESKGPIFFKQKRFGFNNLEIDVLKFRSMYVDRQDVTGAARTTKDDPRVTDGRPHHPAHQHRRAAAAPQRAARRDVDRRPAPARHGHARRRGLLSRCGARLCRPASRPARHHRPGAGARPARRNRYDRAREEARRI